MSIDAASFAGSALVVRLGTAARPAVAVAAGNALHAVRANLRAVFADRWVRSLLLTRWLLPAFAALLLFLAAPGWGWSLALLAVVGLGSCWGLGRDALLMEAADGPLRGATLAVDSSGLTVRQGVGFAGWGALAEVLPLRTTIGVAGGLAVLTLLVFAGQWHRRAVGPRPTASPARSTTGG